MQEFINGLNNNQGILNVVLTCLITPILALIVGLVINHFNKNKSASTIKAVGPIYSGDDTTIGNNNTHIQNQNTYFNASIDMAPDIDFRMQGNYKVENPKGSVFAQLVIPYPSNIASVFLIDNNMNYIGRCSKFEKILINDNELIANYFIETGEERNRLLETIYKQEGKFYALISLNTKEEYIYTFKAQGEGWKISVENNNPNLMDTFILIEKNRCSALSKPAKDILIEASKQPQNSVYLLSTDQTGEFIRVGKQSFVEEPKKYLEALEILKKLDLISQKNNTLYSLTEKGIIEADKLSNTTSGNDL